MKKNGTSEKIRFAKSQIERPRIHFVNPHSPAGILASTIVRDSVKGIRFELLELYPDQFEEKLLQHLRSRFAGEAADPVSAWVVGYDFKDAQQVRIWRRCLRRYGIKVTACISDSKLSVDAFYTSQPGPRVGRLIPAGDPVATVKKLLRQAGYTPHWRYGQESFLSQALNRFEVLAKHGEQFWPAILDEVKEIIGQKKTGSDHSPEWIAAMFLRNSDRGEYHGYPYLGVVGGGEGFPLNGLFGMRSVAYWLRQSVQTDCLPVVVQNAYTVDKLESVPRATHVIVYPLKWGQDSLITRASSAHVVSRLGGLSAVAVQETDYGVAITTRASFDSCKVYNALMHVVRDLYRSLSAAQRQ